MSRRIKDICEYAKYDPNLKLYRCNQDCSAADDCPNKKLMATGQEYYCTNLEINRRLHKSLERRDSR